VIRVDVEGRGAVNRYSNPEELAARIERLTGLKHVATRHLLTSFSFLNRRTLRARPPRRLLLLGGGSETILVLLSGLLRLIDLVARTRLAVYGRAIYFGELVSPVPAEAWANVCVRCGSGHPSDGLTRRGPLYGCPQCGTTNVFTPDATYTHLTSP